MKTILTGLLVALVMLGAGMPVVLAQEEPGSPPTIIRFEVDLASITVPQAEAGDTEALFTWQTVGLGNDHRVALSAYQLNRWEPVTEPDETLPASGSYSVAIDHPLNFGPPTYLLTVLDAAGTALDQRALVIPYTAAAEEPAIENFSTAAQNLSLEAVTNRTARVTVGWRVTGRGPYTNLVFEQVLADGRAVPVELPRPNLWVPSSGEGQVAPVLPEPGQPVRLRLRLVDLANGETLDEMTLPPIPVSGRPAPVPTPRPGVPGEDVTSNLQIISFAATPSTVTRGGEVTVSWEVAGASEVAVWLLDTEGRLSRSAPDPALSGAWTVTLGEQYTSAANFMLFASDALGASLQSNAAVRIECPFTYFFGQAQGSACPAGDARSVQAAYQEYEGGFMLWRAETSEIYVLYDNGQVGRYRDTWKNEYFTFGGGPPPGLIQPQRGFGKVWMDNPAVREGLGWATMPEQGYTMTFQRSGDLRYSRLYLALPDGRVIYLVEDSWGLEVGG